LHESSFCAPSSRLDVTNPLLAAETLAIFLLAFPISAAERGVKRVESKMQTGKTVGLYEESHTLVIGVSDYTDGWPKLPGVLNKDRFVVVSRLSVVPLKIGNNNCKPGETHRKTPSLCKIQTLDRVNLAEDGHQHSRGGLSGFAYQIK
jgi:hypothetical protein